VLRVLAGCRRASGRVQDLVPDRGLDRFPAGRGTRRITGVSNVVVENDADTAGLGEARFGAGSLLACSIHNWQRDWRRLIVDDTSYRGCDLVPSRSDTWRSRSGRPPRFEVLHWNRLLPDGGWHARLATRREPSESRTAVAGSCLSIGNNPEAITARALPRRE